MVSHIFFHYQKIYIGKTLTQIVFSLLQNKEKQTKRVSFPVAQISNGKYGVAK